MNLPASKVAGPVEARARNYYLLAKVNAPLLPVAVLKTQGLCVATTRRVRATAAQWFAQWLTGPLPPPRPGAVAIASWMNRLARPTASGMANPRARKAAMAAEYVHPVPCVCLVAIRGE